MIPTNFSEKTKCPECLRKVAIDDVQFTASFRCPFCGVEIRVSDVYQRWMKAISLILAWTIPFAAGIRNFFVLLLVSFPMFCVPIFIFAYFGKHILPPRLVSLHAPEKIKGKILGLD